MFKQGQKIKAIGVFTVSAINEEFVELDPFGKGSVKSNDDYQTQGVVEFDSKGNKKDFDGFQVDDFIELKGIYIVKRSNDAFTKFYVGTQLVSIPNHKVEVVE